MSSSASEGVIQRGMLLVHIAENGHSVELDCDECTLVEAVQRYLESVSGIPLNDQLLLCSDLKLESQQPLSAYKLPSDDSEIYLFNKARMRSNSPPPSPEQVDIVEIPDPPFLSSSHSPHPLDEASDPALKALPSYERQFRYHYQRGDAIYRRTLLKYETCKRLLNEQKVQEKALDIARGNLDHFYKMIVQNHSDFMKCYTQQHRAHSSLLVNFENDREKLRSCKLHPSLQTDNTKCLLDFVKEDNLRKLVEDCASSHRQFEYKVGEFKHEFGELRHNTEDLFSSKASIPSRNLEVTIKEHQQYMNEQKSVMQALSKDIGMVKRLVDDSLSSQFSSSLRPHDAVSALGPMYEGHDKSYLPNMHSCERAISDLLIFCKDKKTEMNNFVHRYMQKIAYIQYTIKDVRYKFSVFTEALNRQNNQFEHLKVVHGIGPAYRACLAEVVRRKASMKLYMGMAGQMAERLATKRENEVRRREEFLKVHSLYIPREILSSMGLFDTPSQCDVNITPFDSNLLDIDISELDYYAPESLVGVFKRTTKGSFSMANDSSSHPAEVEGFDNMTEKYDSDNVLDASELVDVTGTSKMEVENAKLKAELASAIALLCSISPDADYELLDDSRVNSLLKASVEKTAEALHLKDEYLKHLNAIIKNKQLQCETYEKRIRELEGRLSVQYSVEKLINNESAFTASTSKVDDSKSELMDEASCNSSSLNIKFGADDHKQFKAQETLDENMTDSSGMLNPQLDDEVQSIDKEGKNAMLAMSSNAESISHPMKNLPSGKGLNVKNTTDLVLELQVFVEEKANQVSDSVTKLEAMRQEVAKLGEELEMSRKLLDESQMNCVHLENCLHEAREEAQTHLCAADRRASEYSALRVSAIKLRSLFERLKACVSSGSAAGFVESLRSLSQSLANSANENGDESTAEFRECVRVLADKVGALIRHRSELLDGYSKAEAANEQLSKELEEKKEVVNTLYVKHQLEKQANKEKISFGLLEVHEIAVFILNATGQYEAINRNGTHYFLSPESVALFADQAPTRPTYIVGQLVHIEKQIARPPLSMGDNVDKLTADTSSPTKSNLSSGLTSNPYGLPVGCEYFVVTVAMLPDAAIRSALQPA